MFLAMTIAAAALGQAPAPAAKPPPPIRLAQTDLALVDVPKAAGEFYGNHFAQGLDRAGVQVITPREIAGLIGVERQKQLLNCAEGSSCLVEIASALGADGIVTGEIGKFGGVFQANIRVIASNGSLLATASVQADSERELLNQLSQAASRAAPQIAAKLGRPIAASEVEPSEPLQLQNAVTVNPGGIYFRALSIEYQRMITHRWAWEISAMVLIDSIRPGNFSFLGGGASTGVGLLGGIRYFFFDQGAQGPFAGADIGVASISVNQLSSSTFQLGPLHLAGGYSFLIKDFLYLSLGIGAGPALVWVNDQGTPKLLTYLDIAPRVSLGIAF